MQSYCSDITRYLLAASEGTALLTPKKVVTISIFDFAREVEDWEPLTYLHWNVTSEWKGDHDHRYACDSVTKKKIETAARSLDMNVLTKCFNEVMHDFARYISDRGGITVDAAKAYWMNGIQGDGAHDEGKVMQVMLNRTKLRENSSGTRKALAKTIILFRALRSMTMNAGMTPPVHETQTIREIVSTLAPIVKSNQDLATVMRTASKTEKMLIMDIYAAPEGVDKADYVVAAARNRILGHLRGAGGFIVSCFGRKFEVSSRGDGSCGMYYREFVLSEAVEQSSSTTIGASVGMTVGFMEASISVEANFSRSMGWSMTTEENPTEWKMVKEKSFLDGLGEGPESLGKLLLMMNWHVGGLSDWFTSPGIAKEVHGCVMKEEPITLELTKYLAAIKIDSAFRMGDILAASGSGAGDWRNFLQYKGGSTNTLKFDRVGKSSCSLIKKFDVAAAGNVFVVEQIFKEEHAGHAKRLKSIPSVLDSNYKYVAPDIVYESPTATKAARQDPSELFVASYHTSSGPVHTSHLTENEAKATYNGISKNYAKALTTNSGKKVILQYGGSKWVQVCVNAVPSFLA